MSELPPENKEYTLPAGSMVKIGGLPYQLKDETVVMGCMPLDLLPAGRSTEESISPAS